METFFPATLLAL